MTHDVIADTKLILAQMLEALNEILREAISKANKMGFEPMLGSELTL